MTLDLTKPISAAMLANAGACPTAVRWVRKTYGTKPVTLTRDRLIEAAAVVDVGWLSLFLPAEALAAYRKARAEAGEAFIKATDHARAAFAKDFDKAADDEAIDKAWAAFGEAIAPALAAYAKARAHALADAMRLP